MNIMVLIMTAWLLEVAFGWPDWLYRRIRHPVVWFGVLITMADRTLNHAACPARARYLAGAIASLAIIAMITAATWWIASFLTLAGWTGFAIHAVMASSLIASRSLYVHVAEVAMLLGKGNNADARLAISHIVGRDPSQLDEAGIARTALESLAENASDGVIAPIFWGALLGLPGMAAYKVINTLDSMIGHRNETYAAFGSFAARLDDIANFIPARLTGFLLAAASFRARTLVIMLRDAKRHRSPNAGWPEAAMAGALGVRLSGPRVYGGSLNDESWINSDAPDPVPRDMQAGLRLYIRAMIIGGAFLCVCAAGLSL